MPAGSSASNKAKIARRVIEVLEYFDDAHREATVMDIVRRYNRPQSSTSELLSSLVELGLLRKDPFTRSYSLTPRAALLGNAGQPEMVRDGRLVRLLDRLSAQTGLSVSLMGMVGLDSQIIVWRHGTRSPASTADLFGGCKEPLNRSTAGLLMLSTVPARRAEGMVRRLNAEASAEFKFSHTETVAKIETLRQARYAFGPLGFGADAQSLNVLVPDQPEDHPLIVSVIYGRDDKVNAESLLQSVGDAMRTCLPDPAPSNVEPLQTAA